MMIAPSSMMFPAPITMGPVIANIVTLGWTTVPEQSRLFKVVMHREGGSVVE